MKTDLYTNIILTIIASALSGNFLRPIVTPSIVKAQGGGQFDNVQTGFIPGLGGPGHFAQFLFDSGAGRILVVGIAGPPKGGKGIFLDYKFMGI
jgi:hypothetical protein